MQVTLGDALGLELGKIREEAPVSRHADKCFDTLIWAITGPVIVMPGYTDMAIPDKVRERMRIERLILAARQENMASEAETMWYISIASLVAPLDRDWCEIFFYLTRKYMLSLNVDPPDFIAEPIVLNDMQEHDLKRIREWLFKRSFEEVRRRCKEAQKEAKTEKDLNISTF